MQGMSQGMGQTLNLIQVAQNVKLRQRQIDMEAQAQKAKLEMEKQKLSVETFKTGMELMDNSKSFKHFSKADKTKVLQKTAGAMSVAFGFDLNPEGMEWDDKLADPITAINEIYNDPNLDDQVKRKAIGGKLIELSGSDQKQAQFIMEATRLGLGSADKNKRLEGDSLLSEFASDKVLRMSGLTDEQIAEGRKSGRIPKRISKRDAMAIMPKSLDLFSLLGGRGGSPANQGPLNGENVSGSFGF